MSSSGKPALVIERNRPSFAPTPLPQGKGPSRETFQTSDVRSPENLMQSELTQQDFVHALHSTVDLIPDPPYLEPEARDPETGFPTSPNMKLLQPDFFRSYDLSTLCFIFFFQRGTPQQYFAAKELRRRNWVYHIRYQTWFRRISEPVEKTDEYEVAKYEYFDHGSEGWFVRKRPAFKFEYANMQA